MQRFHPDGSLGKEIRLSAPPDYGDFWWLRPAPGQPQALIYNTSDKKVMQITIQDGDGPLVSEPMFLFDASGIGAAVEGGRHLARVKPESESEHEPERPPTIEVVLNWTEDLKRQLAEAR